MKISQMVKIPMGGYRTALLGNLTDFRRGSRALLVV